MLGGGTVLYYNDGAILENSADSGDLAYGVVDESVARFNADAPGEAVTDISTQQMYALHAVADENSKRLAERNATLKIYNNSAKVGGGIATNGLLTAGSSNIWSLEVEKVWENIDENEWGPVEVFLKIGDEVLDSITLSQDNDWHGTFENLPDPDSLSDEITVVEGRMNEGVFTEEQSYQVSYNLISKDSENHIVSFEVVNEPIAQEVSTVLKAKKVLQGKVLEAEEFEFELRDSEGTLLQTVRNNEEGDIIFDPITYTVPGTYNYSICEKTGNNNSITYDSTTYTVQVVVSKEDGVLKATTDMDENDMVFTNTYTQETPKKPTTPEKPSSPNTSDESNLLLILTLLALSLFGLALILTCRRRS